MPKTCTTCNVTYPDEMVFCPTDGTSLRLDESSGDLIGMVIAQRKVTKLLGEGGMGKVYLAEHVRMPQKSAIKVLHQDMVKDAGAVARFTREAANAARIEHDRVARVFDFGETSDGLVYIAMEFVPGTTLRALLDTEHRLSPVRAANIVYQVAEGLDAAHRLTIVHRDLKPDNVLVITDEAGADRCKVVDFGIAKQTSGSETQLTQMGMLVGTPEFMSPEQVLGEQLDGRSDVYALALVAYEMFSGALPFEGNTPERKLTARLIQDPKTLADVAPDIEWPAELQEAFDRALVREPENRTGTAMEFADAIVNAVEAWTGVSVLRARTPMSNPAIVAAADQTTGVMSRTPLSSPTIAPAKPAPVAAPAATTSTRSQTPGASTSASKVAIPEPTPKKSPVAAIAAVALIVTAGAAYFAFGRGRDGASPSTSAAPPVAVNGTSAPPATPASGTGVPAAAPAGGKNAPIAPATPAAGADAKASKKIAMAAPTMPEPPASSAANDDDARTARRELERLRTALNDASEEETPALANKSIPQFNQLLARFRTADDSAWAYVYIASAYGMAERPDRACEPFRNAKRLGTSSKVKEAIATLAPALTCAP